jgi:hypothetical protein
MPATDSLSTVGASRRSVFGAPPRPGTREETVAPSEGGLADEVAVPGGVFNVRTRRRSDSFHGDVDF